MRKEALVVLIFNLLARQGYVCPGMLVVLTTEPGVRVIQEAWYRHTLVSPPGYTILRLGISGGCSVTPFHQVRNILKALHSHWSRSNKILCSDWLRS